MTSLFETGIRPIIDNHLLELSKERRDYGNYWSASSAGYCMRKNIFERLGVPHVETEDDARKQRVFTAGHIFHSWIQELTQKAGASVAQELELIDDELMVKGHIDDLVKVGDNYILYDYKTVNSQSFKYKKDKMSHYHKMQLGTYLYMLRKSGKHFSEARILNISKDDLRMAEVELQWTQQLGKEIHNYWSTINGYWKKKTMPACTCAKYEINQKTGKGFMADQRYNPYFYNGQPCSLEWYREWKTNQE